MTTPSSPSPDVQVALSNLFDLYIEQIQHHHGELPRVEQLGEFPGRDNSPAILPSEGINEDSTSTSFWKPAPQNDWSLFTGLETGLETNLHPDLITYYGSYWGGSIPCQSAAGSIELIQVWNEEDLDRLRQNLLGHAFMKMKRRQPLTLFFGVAAGEEVLVLDNATGEVYLEIPGRRPHRRLAENLAAFLADCQPVAE